MRNVDEQLHWLVRPATIRKLWIGFIAVLALVVLAEFVVPIKGYFSVDDWFGFGAVYGFASCLLMVLVAKALGVLLKRPDDYYSKADTLDEMAQSETGEHTDGA
ncbi:hypothetical protein F0M18_14180 [Pseudohalioglobus sediminis]|uniref:Uncharacterized protein n=1 Tax=Pseudohalioglobus sediminis TaxID=2606449 RepID=A0A5B0WRE0_9GAMM|nr:hypothetical protein [Pseudohalioglobus sediminis]KAA1189503.1 hypothetical protein F0M18_14180 [Pseudohalioglobus sediminis]